MIALTRGAVNNFEVPTELLGTNPAAASLYFELNAQADSTEYVQVADFMTCAERGVAFRFAVELVEPNEEAPLLGRIAPPAGVRTGTLSIYSDTAGYESDGLLRYTDTFIIID